MNTFVDTKYIGLLSSKLSQFKKKSGNLYNFRCPYCGDSEKSKTKARGYLILNKTFYVYKCHNCEKSTDFGSLLRYVNSDCLLYTSPSPRDGRISRMPSSA